MSDLTDKMRKTGADDGESDATLAPDLAARADRLRLAVREAGGNKAVAKRAGIPGTTLDRYLAGQEMKFSNAVALARAAGVSLEWLATGAGPMRPGDPPAPPAPPAEPPRAQDVLDLDDLATSYEAALNAFVQRGVARPDARKLLALTLALYDGARAILQSQDDENKERRNP
jgi:hypothetical protein